MPAPLKNIYSLMLPGSREVYYPMSGIGYSGFAPQWSEIFVPKTPYIWIPKLTVPQAIAAGAAAAIIRDPKITRRFWAGWQNGPTHK